MFPFLSQLYKGQTGNYGNVRLLGGRYRDTLNYDAIAIRTTMMEAEFKVKCEGILGEANVDVILTKPW